MTDDWKNAAFLLWGEEWIAPLSEVMGINRRTVERWKAGQGEPREATRQALCGLARRAGSDARVTGGILREMAAGECADAIRGKINAMKRALVKIEAESERIASMRSDGTWPPARDTR